MDIKTTLRQYIVATIFLISSLLLPPVVCADESSLFTSVAPDALIVQDLSGSMLWAPAGEIMYYEWDAVNNQYAYYADWGETHPDHVHVYAYGTVPKWSNGSCAGPFYKVPFGDYTTDCSRLAIAKRGIFDILDDNNDNVIDEQDENSLNVRIGYMRFKDGNDTFGDYLSGNNKLIQPLGTLYSTIWTSVNAETAFEGTPLASSLAEAKAYLDYHKSKDKAGACRQKFIILLSDGMDTYACGGGGLEASDTYKSRREAVDKALALANAGYRLFVIGFGDDMPDHLRYTLNWMAFYGNTDNPLAENVGNITAYNASKYNNCNAENVSADPGILQLEGYAFVASSADELNNALKQVVNIIREATFSFSMASIQTSRTTDENYLYEASFEPVNNDPFWLGHLKKFQINADGSVGSEIWDSGDIMQAATADSRTIYTYITTVYASKPLTGMIPFTSTTIEPEDLGLGASETNERNAIVGYIRGEAAYNPDNWKLGDIFRSAPVTIATPSYYFYDAVDTNNAFETFRESHERTSANGKRTIVVGANDGQIHALSASTGEELWSFIPPNLLSKLKNVAHSSHPTGLTHQYFTDGPTTVADVWLGSGDGTAKDAGDWHTLMLITEGRGGIARLWSSSPSCDSGLNATYSATYPYFCGSYCLDVTDTLNPAFKWRLNPSATVAPYVGDPWSKIFPGRVKINGAEKWVGFMGAGFNAQDCSNINKCDTRGKGFLIVDLDSGEILWSVTLNDNAAMINSLPATPGIVDTDNDNFIDTVYVGDLGGNMWRMKLCRAADGDACNTSNWSSNRLFDSTSSTIRPIYTAPSVARDTQGNLWIYFGTGDKDDPTSANAQEIFFAVKDNDRTSTWNINNLENILGGTYSDPSKVGWYITLPGGGEKILAEPTVFGGVVYFTTFTPDQTGDPCSHGGDASIYGVDYTTGGGIFENDERSIVLGQGIPTAPVISLKPGEQLSPDLYVTISGGGADGGSSTFRASFDPPAMANRTNMLFWRDNRLQ